MKLSKKDFRQGLIILLITGLLCIGFACYIELVVLPSLEVL